MLVEENTKLVKISGISVDSEVVQKGNQLEIQEEGSQERFTVKLGNFIFRDPVTVGRSTAVSDQGPGTDIVVKISWPSSGRVRETDILKKASEEAGNFPWKWARNHLPRVFYSRDVTFGENSTIESVARLFKMLSSWGEATHTSDVPCGSLSRSDCTLSSRCQA